MLKDVVDISFDEMISIKYSSNMTGWLFFDFCWGWCTIPSSWLEPLIFHSSRQGQANNLKVSGVFSILYVPLFLRTY